MRKIYFLIIAIILGSVAGYGQVISQYIETSSGTTPKGIELWNNTEVILDFSINTLIIKKGVNGGTPSDDYTLDNGTLEVDAVIVIGTSDMQSTTESNGATFYEKSFTFNGDDALEVWYGSTKTDVFGEPGSDPGTGWSGNGVQTYDQNIALIASISTGDTNGWSDPSTRFETVCVNNCLDGFGVSPNSGLSPTISINLTSLTGFTYQINNGPSSEQTFTVEGSNLTNDISLTAPTDYEISETSGSGFTTSITLTQTDGTVNSTTIYTRLKSGLAIGNYNNENITVSSDGSTDKTVSCNGVVTTGNGTIDNPYSCSEIIALESPGTTDIWAAGYIVGYFTGTTTVVQEAPFTSDANIALADNSNETDHNNMISVQLLDNSDTLRDILGLSSNSNNIGENVIIKGDLIEYYSHNGIKNTTDYKWGNDVSITSTGNWSNNTTWGHGKPGQHDNVLISSYYLTVDDTSASCNNIIIEDGVSLIGTENLTVNGSATMQRTIDGYTDHSNGWHLVSSPVSMTIAGSDFEPGTASPNLDDIYAWNESTSQWLNYKDAGNNITSFAEGKGYLVAYETGSTKNFEGAFNSSDVVFTNLSQTGGSEYGWHLLGNPFQSAIQWTSGWSQSNIAVGAKIMNPGGTYTDIVIGGNDIIPANQGFFIQVTEDANNSITIPTSARIHDDQSFYKNSIKSNLVLTAVNGDSYQESTIQFMDGSSMGFDNNFDIKYLRGFSSEAPVFYSNIEDYQLSTNRIPYPEKESTVILSCFTEEETIITLNASGIDSFDNDIDILLEDKVEKITINLRKEDSYTFLSTSDNGNERFNIRFGTALGTSELAELTNINIYSSNNKLIIINNKKMKGEINIINIMGQKINSFDLTGDTNQEITINTGSGIYIVNIRTSVGDVVSEKIIITN